MKVQNHINIIDGVSWYRCRKVEFSGEEAIWDLNPASRYLLADAYERAPHLQLAKASDDGSLRAFVKGWGPLRSAELTVKGYEPALDAWNGTDSIEQYRCARDKMTALMRLLASAADPEEQRSSLFVLLKGRMRNLEANWAAGWFGAYDAATPGTGGLVRWLETADCHQLEAVTKSYISRIAAPFGSTRFSVVQKGTGFILKDHLRFPSILHALYWMVWRDIYTERQFLFCSECRAIFQPDNHHARKFCTQECAHRSTARAWQQRKREKERMTSGTQKAR